MALTLLCKPEILGVFCFTGEKKNVEESTKDLAGLSELFTLYALSILKPTPSSVVMNNASRKATKIREGNT